MYINLVNFILNCKIIYIFAFKPQDSYGIAVLDYYRVELFWHAFIYSFINYLNFYFLWFKNEFKSFTCPFIAIKSTDLNLRRWLHTLNLPNTSRKSKRFEIHVKLFFLSRNLQNILKKWATYLYFITKCS